MHGYEGVRGRQGAKKDKFQGFPPRKTHLTKLCNTAHEAAISRALLKRELQESREEHEEKKPRKPRCDKKRAPRTHPQSAPSVPRDADSVALDPCMSQALTPQTLHKFGQPLPAMTSEGSPPKPLPTCEMAAPWSHFRPDLPVAMFVMPLERISYMYA